MSGIRTVLIRCRADDSPRETNVSGCYPPLGLAYLAAVLRAAGHSVSIVDAEVYSLTRAELVARLPPDATLVGFTSTTLLWPSVRLTAAAVRRAMPRATLVVGGPQVIAFPEDTLASSVFNAGVIGDGEATIVEIAARLAAHAPITDVPGCVIRDDQGGIRVNGPARWVEDLDSLPLPAIDLLPVARYRSILARDPFVTMITSRGCPYRCTFCSQIYTGPRLRTRSPAGIIVEMERAVKEYGAREIILFDETFGVKRDEALQLCALIRERGLTVRWSARTRIDVLDAELLSAMRRAGCYFLHLGIESGSQRVLDLMQKRITLDEASRVVRMARELGFFVHGYFMLGYPGETRRETAATTGFSRRLGLDVASYTIAIPNPRTPLYDDAVRQGYIAADFWREYTFGRISTEIPLLATRECPAGFLRRAARMAYLRFFLRPAIVARNIRFLKESGNWRQVWYAFRLWLREELR
jgi:radical SAM superfamily enzyme YgiQ (UPF0313 family)